MRVAVFTGPGQIEIRNEPDPVPGPFDLLIDVGACGVCTFERRLFAGEKRWYPVAPGHEAAGVVIAAGDKVADLPGSPQVGDTVTFDLLTRCGTCGPCRRGKTSLCRTQQGGLLSDGTVTFGGFADKVAIPAASAYPTGNAPVTHAAMGEPIACVMHSLRQGGFGPGDRVAIIGGGFMGRLHLAIARIGGAASVGIIDVSEQRRQEALAAGASWVASPDEAQERGGSQDIVFVTAMGGVDLAVAMCDFGGTVVLYSAFDKDLQAMVGADKSHREEVAIVGAYSQEPIDWRLGSAYIRSGVLHDDLEALITARFDFTQVEDALRLVTSEPTYRVFVEPTLRDA